VPHHDLTVLTSSKSVSAGLPTPLSTKELSIKQGLLSIERKLSFSNLARGINCHALGMLRQVTWLKTSYQCVCCQLLPKKCHATLSIMPVSRLWCPGSRHEIKAASRAVFCRDHRYNLHSSPSLPLLGNLQLWLSNRSIQRSLVGVQS
jgi:hypothetical protein